jgi:hypothetical protein
MGNAKERVKRGSGKRKNTINVTSSGFANGRNTGLKTTCISPIVSVIKIL